MLAAKSLTAGADQIRSAALALPTSFGGSPRYSSAKSANENLRQGVAGGCSPAIPLVTTGTGVSRQESARSTEHELYCSSEQLLESVEDIRAAVTRLHWRSRVHLLIRSCTVSGASAKTTASHR